MAIVSCLKRDLYFSRATSLDSTLLRLLNLYQNFDIFGWFIHLTTLMSQRLWDTRFAILNNFTDDCSSSNNKSDRKLSKATIEQDYGFLLFCRKFPVLIHWSNFGSDPSPALIFSIHYVFNNFDKYHCACYIMKKLKITVKNLRSNKKR